MRLKQNKLLIVCIAVPLIVGGLAGLLTRGGMQAYQELNQPTFAPPGWLFPVVWTVLYILMGIASYLILTSRKNIPEQRMALLLYATQLLVNFLWPIFFFGLGWYLFSFFWLLLLWGLVAATLLAFYRISKPAAYLLFPYLLWLTFAGYLNLAIVFLN